MLKNGLFLVAIIAVMSSFCIPSLAAPVSGTDPAVDGHPWVLAIEYDYIYDRDVESSDIKGGKIETAQTAYGKLLFRPDNFFSFYGKVGVANLETDMDLNTGQNIKEEYKVGLYTGGGVKFILEVVPSVRIAVDNQFNYWSADIDDVEFAGLAATTKTGDATIWEYQIAGIISYVIDWQKVVHPIHGEYPTLIPYVGAKYAYLDMDSDVGASGPGFSISAPDSRENDDSIGVVLGLDVDFATLSGFGFNIECRFLDETAISAYASYNF